MIPEHTKQALIEWVKNGNKYDHGSFIMALVSNDLIGSFHKADDSNLNNMFNIVKWMYNVLPASCYGSKEEADSWNGLSSEEFDLWLKARKLEK